MTKDIATLVAKVLIAAIVFWLFFSLGGSLNEIDEEGVNAFLNTAVTDMNIGELLIVVIFYMIFK